MSEKRKDSKGRILQTGETQLENGRYRYFYKDTFGKRKGIYADDLAELRNKERQIQRDMEDGIETYLAQNLTLNTLFEKYMQSKSRTSESTKVNYKYLYDRFIRDELGKKKVAQIKYSDIKSMYLKLLNNSMKMGTLMIIHNVLHPTFETAVRDDIIRKNPTNDVIRDIKNERDFAKEKRSAMNEYEQIAFLNQCKESAYYSIYYPMFVFMLGTGCRIGEMLGLTWKDVDFGNNLIKINKSLVYKRTTGNEVKFYISNTKTACGNRTIPMLSDVKKALLEQREMQFMLGGCNSNIDGHSDFVFTNRSRHVHKPATINRVINGIIEEFNKNEEKKAKEERREPKTIKHYSAHSMRHTFATNYCQHETNLKTIQEIMGHSNISVTMNVYAEATAQKKAESFRNLEGKMLIG